MQQRVAYIDAMRGLTMVLVVYSHVCSMCLGDSQMAANGVLFLFRLPCFFFISGLLFCKPGRAWTGSEIRTVITRKAQLQLVPTLIFLLLLAPPPLFFHQLGATKGGYWFTFALFEFFSICIFSERYFRQRGGLVVAVAISVAAYSYDVYYNRYFSHYGIVAKVMGLLSFMTWRYYLFFYLGTLAKCHLDVLHRVADHRWPVAGVALTFVLVAAVPHTEHVWLSFAVFAIGGMAGMVLVYSLFRRYYRWRLPLLELLGRRTLDIYLLHYFFLPRFLLSWGEVVRGSESVALQALTVMAIAVAVTAVSLAVSWVLRLSPLLAHLLFGERNTG